MIRIAGEEATFDTLFRAVLVAAVARYLGIEVEQVPHITHVTVHWKDGKSCSFSN